MNGSIIQAFPAAGKADPPPMTEHQQYSVVFVPDTNLLLHCRPLAELPWRELSGGRPVEILLTQPVLKELDRFKRDGNSRRARRAREIIPLLRELYHSPALRLRLNDKGDEVFMATEKLLNAEMGIPIDADDRIVESAVAYASQSQKSVMAISDDVGLLLTARLRNLPSVPTPDGWLRPPEETESEKQNQQLRDEVKALRDQRARFAIKVEHEGSETSLLELVIPRYQKLEPEEVKDLTEYIQGRVPIPAISPPTTPQAGHPGMTSATAAQNELTRERYREKLANFFMHLPRELERRARHPLLEITISNSGQASGVNARVDIGVSDGLVLQKPIPIAPVSLPRRPSVVQQATGTSPPTSSRILAPLVGGNAGGVRQRLALRFSPNPSAGDTHWSMECEEFRLQQKIYVQVIVPYVEPSIEGGWLTIEVDAAKPALAASKRMPIRLRYQEQDIQPELRRLLGPNWSS
jgi:hypothetical protein